MIPPPPTVRCWSPSADSPLDPRIHAFRPDLADGAKDGEVGGTLLAAAMVMRCRVARSTVFVSPGPNTAAISELVAGERFHVVERGPDWLWGWCGHDHYVGYVELGAFDNADAPYTHRVAARAALAFSGPSIKAPLTVRLPIGALVRAEDDAAPFYRTEHGFIHHRHLAPIDSQAAEPLDTAIALIGAPYLWGGRTGEGIDCSGLIQVALGLCGIAAPRDTDQQMAALGKAVDPAHPTRGDLVFFPGHVGIMVDEANLLHANAHWMTTLVEPLADVIARLAPTHTKPVLAVRRL